VFLVSVLVNALFGFAVMLPYDAIVALAMVAGFVVQGNFSNLTSGVLAIAEPWQRGATVAVYSCIGFAGGFLGTLMFGVVLDRLGADGGLAGGIRHLCDCVPSRLHRNRIPTAQCGVGVDARGQ
jgi:hypothetical protein